MGRLIILIIKFLLCLYRTLKENPSSLKQKRINKIRKEKSFFWLKLYELVTKKHWKDLKTQTPHEQTERLRKIKKGKSLGTDKTNIVRKNELEYREKYRRQD